MGCSESTINASESPPHREDEHGKLDNVNTKPHDSREERSVAVAGPPPDLRIKGDWRRVNMDKVLKKMQHHQWRDVCRQFQVKKAPVIKPQSERKGWKTVRLFVSSTFRDMSSERELLIKHIFPELSAWCEKRRLRFFEVDLRWGVPKNSEAGVTLKTCLSEITRCQQYNENAFFLSLLSERYGWVPTNAQVPAELKQTYKWLPGIAVTAWEVMAAAYWDRNPNALFCIRHPSALEAIRNPHIRDQFYESDPNHKESLNFLKAELARNFPDQTYQYKCSLEEETATDVTFGGLEELGRVVLHFFKNAISRQYPPAQESPEMDLFADMNAEQEKFIAFTTASIKGRAEEIQSVMTFVTADHATNHPLVVEGPIGVGKSTVLAACVRQCQQMKHFTVFSHSAGATPGSSDWFLFLSRLRLALLPAERLPETLGEMTQTMGVFMKRAVSLRCSRANSKIVLFIDALHLIDSGSILSKYSLITDHAHGRLRVVISVTSSELPNVQKACPRMTTVQISSFDIETRKAMVESIFALYNKRLDSTQMNAIISKRDSGLPMYLDIVCEELRVFGVFELLDSKINDLPEDMMGLLKSVFERTILENGDDLVVATLCLMVTSRDGLMEIELRKLLVMEPILPRRKAHKKKKEFKVLPMAQWTPIYLALRYYLTHSELDQLSFVNTLRHIVREVYIPEKEALWWHKRLADHFKNSRFAEHRAIELPYHLHKLGEFEALRKVLLEKEIFDQMYTDEMKNELVGYWRDCGGYKLAAEQYQTAFTDYIIDAGIEDLEEIAVIQVKLAWFFIDIGQFDAAQSLLEGLLEELIGEFGPDAHQLMLPLKALVTMFHRKAQTFIYSTEDDFKICFSRGKQFAELCAKVFANHRHANDITLGETFAVCGYFLGVKYLEVARQVFEEVGYTNGLVEVLYYLGEKNQFNADADVPISYFDQALELGLSFFGENHRHVARCYQLYAQFYWNLYLMDESQSEYLTKAIESHVHQVGILADLLGDDHPETRAARDKLKIARGKIT